MNQPPGELIEVVTTEATDAVARLTLRETSQGQIAFFRGDLRGPRCLRARTLASSFSVTGEKSEESKSVSSSTMITDPCYWSPAMPFLYDLKLEVEFSDGSTQQCQQSIGLRRLETHGPNLLREGKRVVLRGISVQELSLELLNVALKAELSLLVAHPNPELVGKASELGVSVVVDMRKDNSDLENRLTALGWQAAVEGILLGEGPMPRDSSALLGQSIKSSQVQPVSTWAPFLFCEFKSSEQLPAWLATTNKPVVAWRAADSHSDLIAARRACDRLQSDLAPEFDLAGYFV